MSGARSVVRDHDDELTAESCATTARIARLLSRSMANQMSRPSGSVRAHPTRPVPRPSGSPQRLARRGSQKKGPLSRPFFVGVLGGDKGDRTPDLVNAIHALSQLSYIPVDRAPVLQIGAGCVKPGRPPTWCGNEIAGRASDSRWFGRWKRGSRRRKRGWRGRRERAAISWDRAWGRHRGACSPRGRRRS